MRELLRSIFFAPPAGEDLDERGERLIEELAQRIVSQRLETPAIFFLEMNKPLTFLASQSLLLATPLLGAFIKPSRIEEYSQLLDSRDNMERLIGRIDELAERRDAEGGAS